MSKNLTDKEKLEIGKQALLFYSRMRFHSREAIIRSVIDKDNGKRAIEALEKINLELSKPFFDEDV